MEKEIFGVMSVLVLAVAYVDYLWRVLNKKTKPHSFSWFVWGLNNGLVFFAQRSDNAGAGSWSTGFGASACFIFAALAVIWGERDIKRSDIIALSAAVIAISLWPFTGTPLSSVILITLIDIVGFYPTVRKSYVKPWEESTVLFALVALQSVLMLIALENVTLVTALNSAATIPVNLSFVSMVLWRRRFIPRIQKA